MEVSIHLPLGHCHKRKIKRKIAKKWNILEFWSCWQNRLPANKTQIYWNCKNIVGLISTRTRTLISLRHRDFYRLRNLSDATLFALVWHQRLNKLENLTWCCCRGITEFLRIIWYVTTTYKKNLQYNHENNNDNNNCSVTH